MTADILTSVVDERIRQDEKALASVGAQIAKLKKQMNL